MENKTQIILIIGIILVLVTLSIFTLPISPLPWFDEVFFSSIAYNFAGGNAFEFTVAPPYLLEDRQEYTYGPVYFIIAAIPYLLFDSSEWLIRIISLLFGIFGILMISKLLKGNSIKVKLILTLLILSDIIFTSNSHGGRMDTMAIAFWLGGLFIFFEAKNMEKTKPWLVGFLFALGYLITPRSFMIYGNIAIIIPIYLLIKSNLKSAFITSLKLATSFVIPVAIWIVWAFGSFKEYQLHYAQLSSGYIGGTPPPPVFQWPLIFCVCALLLYGLIAKREKFIQSFGEPIVPFSIVSIISFYFLVFDTGTYSIFIIFLYYFLFVTWSSALLPSKLKYVVLIGFTLGNLLLISAKYSVVLSGERWAKKAQMHSFILKNVPTESRLVGGEIYYYGCLKHHVDFQFMEYFLSDYKREQYHREVFNYEYLFVSQRLLKKNPELIELYLKNSTLSAIDTLYYNNNPSSLPIIESLRRKVHNSYDGVLYKRNKSSKLDR